MANHPSRSRSSDSSDEASTSQRRNDDRSTSRHRAKKSKKRRTRSRSRSASSSASDSSTKLLQRLEAKRLKEAVERKRRKEELKQLETPEEKRARRMQEKQVKEYKRRERMGWDNEYQHYTNQDNPFGDAHLTSTFVWNKKLEKKGLTHMTNDELEIINRQKQLENKNELEKVKKRRQERELERMQREDEMVMMQRSREAAQFDEWERQEDQFHLEQARLRSKIRITDGRAKPIDLLAQYISSQKSLEESIEMQMHEPYTYLNGLGSHDLDDLLVDIKVYIELEKGDNTEYWEDLTVIVQDELQKLRKLEMGGDYQATVGRREGIHQSVAHDVTSIFRGKTAVQLEELRTKIESKIEQKADGVDIGYWESLLSQLKAHMARARLKDKHQENLRSKLEMLKQEQLEQQQQQGEARDEKPGTSAAMDDIRKELLESEMGERDEREGGASDADNDGADDGEEDAAAMEATDLLAVCFAMYEERCYSPIYIVESELEREANIIEAEADESIVDSLRNRLTGQPSDEMEPQPSGSGTMTAATVTDDAASSSNPERSEELRMTREARKGMGRDEAEFSVETKLDSQVYLWSDKYRPRKPRYFNRVHTGFEWNKYNQTHYDMDNPPPKIVQGYKFNIFYPDLINKGCTPQYFLVRLNENMGSSKSNRTVTPFASFLNSQTPCNDNKDFALLRFHAGPPYEDLAFKIVNREWEFSYKRGFRCQFQNNIFQLWFHFKRYRYRR